jgi:ribonuclease P protein component
LRRSVRAGARAGSRTVVLHLGEAREPAASAKVGFIVSGAVGGAVVRNRVRRRLRHLVGERLGELSPASVLVVRALPAAASATYDELRADLGRCLERVATQRDRHPATPRGTVAVMQP